MADGVTEGWTKGLEKAKSKITEEIEDAQEAYRKAMTGYWDINSPSKVAEEDAYNIGVGWANGIAKAADPVLDAIADLNEGTESGLLGGFGDTILEWFTKFNQGKMKINSLITGVVTKLFGTILPEGKLNDLIQFLNGKFEGFTGELAPENLLEGIQEYIDKAYSDLDLSSDWSMTGFLDFDSMMSEFQAALDEYTAGLNFDVGITPVLTDDSALSDIADYSGMLSGSYKGTIAGYSAEDVQNLTKEIYHLEDALYSLKNAMQNQQVTHTGELTIKYSSESDFIDRIQTAVIGNIRKGIRS